MRTIIATFSDGNTITTDINGTEQEIRAYYLGQWFNFGDRDWGDPDNMQRCVRVDFLN